MIEEIVKVIEKAEGQCYPLTYCRKCKYQNIKGHCCFYNYAEKIEKAGYRHINEVRKETAKEILKSLLDRFSGYEMSYYNGYEEVVAEFEQFIKAFFNEEYGVEVEE